MLRVTRKEDELSCLPEEAKARMATQPDQRLVEQVRGLAEVQVTGQVGSIETLFPS